MDKEELKNLEKIKTLSQTEGGQYLISVSKDIVVSTVDILSANYKDMTRDELVSLCAKLNESLGTYKLLTGINDKIESIKELYKE
jgi:gamma-glutamyl phosphate reductase